MSTAPCYTDLPVVKRSYASAEGVCGKTEYLKPVGEFTTACVEVSTGTTCDVQTFIFKNVKLRSTVPTNQIVTFYVDMKFTDANGFSPGLFGGNHFTNDLAVALKIPHAEAERIKINHGCVLAEQLNQSAHITVQGLSGTEPKEIKLSIVAEVLGARADELFEIINNIMQL